jgi:hypothetical protein
MTTDQPHEYASEVRASIDRVALSLDAFLLNGIPYGVLQREALPGFLEQAAGNLLTPLASLELQASQVPASGPADVRQMLADLRAKCQQLIDHVTGLTSFRILPQEQVRTAVAKIPVLREECVQLLGKLEACLGAPQRVFPGRSSHHTAAVNSFLANLQRMFEVGRSPFHVEHG